MSRFIFLILITFISCAKNDSTRDPRLHYLSAKMQEQFNTNKIKLNCPSGDCPESVALIYIEEESDAHVCTGSLFNEDHILTNSHCLSNFDIASSCEDIHVFFRTKDGQSQIYGCEEIIHVNDLSNVNVLQTASIKDYAVFKLKNKPDLENLSIKNPKVLNNNDPVQSYVTDVTSNITKDGQPIVNITKIDCSYSVKSYWTPANKDHFSPFMTLNGCGVIKGNSGSALLSQKGEFVGLIHATVNETETRLVSKDLFESLAGTELSIGYAISAHCIDISELPDHFSATKCDVITDEAREEIYSELIMEAFKPLIEPLKSIYEKVHETDKFIRWEYVESELSHIPVCLKREPVLPLSNSITFTTKFKKKEIQLYLTEDLLPVYRFRGQLEDYVYESTLLKISPTDYQIKITDDTYKIKSCEDFKPVR